MRREEGFTLMELLVVLLIIGVLSTVALRTIDATRDRALFDQTTREMKELVQAITGNPDLVANGRRVDFGFYGDMGRMPLELRELVENTTGSNRWHGPYLRRPFTSDTAGFLYDAWGHPYTYDRVTGTIASLGKGRYPMTMRVVEDTAHLSQNTIFGSVTDNNNSPPGEMHNSVTIQLFDTDGSLEYWVRPDPGGYFEFSPQNGRPVTIGHHMIRALRGTADTITRWVTVVPRSRTVVDFRFTRPFRNQLVMIGEPELKPGGDGFDIVVVNEGPADDTVDYFKFVHISETTYMRMLAIRDVLDTVFYPRGRTVGEDVPFRNTVVVGPNRSDPVKFSLLDFKKDSLGLIPDTLLHREFHIRFSDGSELRFTVSP
ncbi:MAG: prepilin-type N-terminal cleavage/methylation domain-containing protein [candidate division WOR-3 bacterium]